MAPGKEEFMEEVARCESIYHRNSKDFKDKSKKAKFWENIVEKFHSVGGGGGGQIPQHENCIWSLSKAIENATFWIEARRSAKRITKSVD